MTTILNFCQKHYYMGFVFFGIGGGIEILSPHLPPAFAPWVAPSGLSIMILSAALLAIGLIMEGRQRKRDGKIDRKR
jgi:hypothetical protein